MSALSTRLTPHESDPAQANASAPWVLELIQHLARVIEAAQAEGVPASDVARRCLHALQAAAAMHPIAAAAQHSPSKITPVLDEPSPATQRNAATPPLAAAPPAASDRVRPGCGRFAAQVKAIIEAEYDAPLTVGDIARRLYLSPNYISRVFKAETGMTIMQYLTHVRVEMAKRLLASDPSLKAYEVGERVGYPDPVYFNKLFKRVVGMTPRQYRLHAS
ncbi:hypothetical protein GCM10010885_06980 [Alicyclobacillus cellulosilyticus]|uniref:HTH araC/xylS-type domain-containing protein n=1 Tax=Alicyclobacillus cellulosilyticus TaxID=1003997 RepID=A0A917NIG6_9BACL|nr:AraC family transcriptional regulator [Alicyclobacillus cellulosilyticus]GGJ00352.1 hypothetical protein GCM10010885_06980 [Alicyclobacillus cellulosilyticus]